jgi:hypothetical protein
LLQLEGAVMHVFAIIAALILVIVPHGPRPPHGSGDTTPAGAGAAQSSSQSTPQPIGTPAPNTALEYAMGLDALVVRDGHASSFIKNKVANPTSWGSTMQALPADDVRGKRLMVSGYIKTSAIKQYAEYWVRVDGADHQVLAYDDMSNRPLSGTADWRAFTIVLDVPENATSVSMGLLLNGTGEAWVGDVSVAVVTKDVPLTGPASR